ncbi:extracellular solute-binding protein [Amycolatopsis acidicola]|uniref:Extracellular solute-binding protein n=1 Tax=Amycolatopsis acidicola TaxID=2596893 RepID=A0A5N0V4J9_9PSEU|nr:extracellular solute-binding protein [Amycolatopsis acidicola]KAA9160905.1 extracellular solute-binding protein [Amycolatopsis acidicola]
MKRLATLLAATVLAAATLVGCSTSTETLTVLGPWTGAEEQSFRALLDAYTAQTHVEVNYQGNAAVNQVLLADVRKGQAPDVAVLSSPGELARYAHSRDLHPITDVVTLPDTEYSSQWRSLLQLGTADLYAVPVKADLKSLVWYDPARSPGPKPATWDELLAYTTDAASHGVSPWCLGVEAYSTSGWPGTDWIEDILLHRHGAKYEQWAAGELPWTSPEVRDAWESWGRLLRTPNAVQGGRSGALLTYFGDAGKPMFTNPPGCLLEHQASFAPGAYPATAKPDYFPFPGGDPEEASVNLAGMFTDSPAARDLMAFLASARAQAIWPMQTGSRAYSVNQRVLADGVYQDDVSRRIGRTLATGKLCLDASDVMPADMADAFSRGVLEYLADPGQLDAILAGLEEVRAALPSDEHLAVPCAR